MPVNRNGEAGVEAHLEDTTNIIRKLDRDAVLAQREIERQKIIESLLKPLFEDRLAENDKDGNRIPLIDKFIQEAEHARSAESTAFNTGWDVSMRSMVGLMKSFAEALEPSVAFHLGRLTLWATGNLLQGGDEICTRFMGYISKDPLPTPDLHYEISVHGGRFDVELTDKEGAQLEHLDQWKGFFQQAVGVLLRSKEYRQDGAAWRDDKTGDLLTKGKIDEWQNEFNDLLKIPSFAPKPSDSPQPSMR